MKLIIKVPALTPQKEMQDLANRIKEFIHSNDEEVCILSGLCEVFEIDEKDVIIIVERKDNS